MKLILAVDGPANFFSTAVTNESTLESNKKDTTAEMVSISSSTAKHSKIYPGTALSHCRPDNLSLNPILYMAGQILAKK